MLLATDDISTLEHLGSMIGVQGYQLGSFLAVLLVSIIVGMIGTLVVGNRMAFFSDAMAHCAFAGIAG